MGSGSTHRLYKKRFHTNPKPSKMQPCPPPSRSVHAEVAKSKPLLQFVFLQLNWKLQHALHGQKYADTRPKPCTIICCTLISSGLEPHYWQSSPVKWVRTFHPDENQLQMANLTEKLFMRLITVKLTWLQSGPWTWCGFERSCWCPGRSVWSQVSTVWPAPSFSERKQRAKSTRTGRVGERYSVKWWK